MTPEIGYKINLGIPEATVVGRDGNRALYLQIGGEHGPQLGPIPLDHPDVIITRVPPSHWPPRPGDVWQADGKRWFAYAIWDDDYDSPIGVRLINEDGRVAHNYFHGMRYSDAEDKALLDNSAELHLVTRRGDDVKYEEPPF